MKIDRLLLRFSDGTSEWQTPGTVPEVGAIVRRGGQEWIVASIDADTQDAAVVLLRRAPRTDVSTDVQVEVA
jgi:hypothetical protein